MISSSPVSFASLRPSSTPAPPPSGCAFPSKWAGIWGEAVTLEEALARSVVNVGGARGLAGVAGLGGGFGGLGGIGGVGGAGATLVLPQEGWAASGFWSEIAAVRRETGIRGLWKGVGTTL
jgi:solute carrier family 25 protein 39/40